MTELLNRLAEEMRSGRELRRERDRYWQALVDIADWENWQARTGNTTPQQIAQQALDSMSTP